MPYPSLSRTAPLAGIAALLLLAGCASVPRDAGFTDVRQSVAERAGLEAVWHRDAPEDRQAAEAVRGLLADSLTAEAAVQIALLNNRRLQATYEELGVAQAELVQAGLLRNPVFGAHPRWPLHGGPPDLAFSVAMDFLGIFTLPLRRAVAASAFEAARFRVTGAVLQHAAETRATFYRAQADRQHVEMLKHVVLSTEAAYVAAQRLREAGNIRRLDLLSQQALYEQARLDLESAESQALQNRERLNRLMGLWGTDTDWAFAHRLPDPPAEPIEFGENGGADLERRAVEASLDLAAARQDIETFGRRLGIADVDVLIPELHLGVEVEREDGEWKLGPDVEIALPLLDQGQARRAGARAALRQQQAAYLALGVEVRSSARAARQQLLAARRSALHYRNVVLPLRAELTHETQLQYNAMQIGVFQLLEAQRQEIDAGRRYLDALAVYWQARTDLDLLLQGVTPEAGAGAGLPAASAPVPVMAPGH